MQETDTIRHMAHRRRRSPAAGIPAPIILALALLLGGCPSATTGVSFPSAPVSRVNPQTQSLTASFAKPEGPGPFPAVVLLHSCGGIMSHMGDWSEFLRSNGYAALTVQSFASRGQRPCPNRIGTHTWVGVEMIRDAYGALDHLASRPDVDASRIYVMGFSLGGWTIRNMARQESASAAKRNFRGAIALYDGCSGYSGKLTFPTMVVIGTNDGHDFPSCKQAAETKPSPDLELHILEGVYHAFDEPAFRAVRHDVGGRPMLYNAGAVETSRRLVLEFLQKHR